MMTYMDALDAWGKEAAALEPKSAKLLHWINFIGKIRPQDEAQAHAFGVDVEREVFGAASV